MIDRGRLKRWLDDTLWGPETGARLLVVHVGLSALIGVRIVASPFHLLADVPPALVDPVPFLFWLQQMPSLEAIVGLQVIGGVAALAAVLRRRPRLSFAVAWVCYLILTGLRGSRGKVMHNDLLVLWASAPFLLAPVAVTLRDRVPRRMYGWPIRVAVTVAVLVYFFTGYHKLRRAGPAWVFGDNMSNIMRWAPNLGRTPWEGAVEWLGTTPWAALLTAAFLMGLELSFPVVLIWRRLQPWYACGAVMLHSGTWVLLGLDYWAWAATVPLLLIDWPAVVARLRRPRPGPEPRALTPKSSEPGEPSTLGAEVERRREPAEPG